MGMFDYIECEYKLPLPDFTEEESNDLSDIEWAEVEFQTKNFDSVMIKYTITEDGLLYENKIDREWVEDKESPMGVTINEREDGIERVDHSGHIVFYGLVLGKEHDHWFEFKTLWWKGDLKEIDLTEYKKENNSERLKVQKDFDDALKDFSSKNRKWWFPVYRFYRSVLAVFFGAIRWSVGFVARTTWKIERWLP